MKNKERLWEICLEIYRQMFKEAKPSADFDELRKKKVTTKSNWFMKYFLDNKRQKEIIDEICKKHKIRNFYKRAVEEEVHLGCLPNTCIETWKEARNEA